MHFVLLDATLDLPSTLVSILILLIAVIYTTLKTQLTKVDSRGLDHEKRVQRIEDVQGSKIDALAVKIDNMEKSITDLSYNVHKEKNIENQFVQTLERVLHYMETHNGIKSE